MDSQETAKLPLNEDDGSALEGGEKVSLTPGGATASTSPTRKSPPSASSSARAADSRGLLASGATPVDVRAQYNTLDEPIKDTIMRELRSIGAKLWLVLRPGPRSFGADRRLHDWDLWGPLILCMTLGCILSTEESQAIQEAGDGSTEGYTFALIFSIVWVGSGFVTLNAMLLGGSKVSFFMCVCLLGYCLFPLVAAAIALMLLGSFFSHNSLELLLKVAIVAGALAWSTYASVGFMAGLVQEEKKGLAVYPIWLFYVAIAWIIFIT
mmetsp:Transcript_52310/g.96819  ORF Transcript_52310/g.96819 Transcript_52310/m.96819 type:complete len:267 (+) Transcript_52310:52-852(+)